MTENLTWHKIFNSLEEAEKNLRLNKSMLIEVAGKEICFSRVQQGFFAVDDECPHLGDSLSRGTCNYLGEVICPWHSYRFSLQTGEETTGHGYQLKKYPLKVEADGIFVGLPA